MEKVTLLHISDLHLVKTQIYELIGRTYDKTALKALARFIHIIRDKIDCLVISGDIAHWGTYEDLTFAKSFLISPSATDSRHKWNNRDRNPTLTSLEKPIILMPGNHDRYDHLSFPRSGYFNSVFKDFLNSESDRIQVNYVPSEDNPKIALISADFSLEMTSFLGNHPGGTWGQGEVNDKIEELAYETEKINQSDKPVPIIWVVHFAPLYEKYYHLRKDLRLINAEALLTKAQELRIKYIMCGHTHHQNIYPKDQSLGLKVLCSGTSAVSSGPYHPECIISVVNIEKGKIVRVNPKSFHWEGGDYFVPDPNKKWPSITTSLSS